MNPINALMPAKQSLTVNLLILFAAIFIFAAVFELAVRFFAPQPVFTNDIYSPRLVRENIPYREFVFRGREFAVPIKYNSWGMRDRERKLKKDENVFRVAVLGDSFMEALHVPFDDSFTFLLEDELKRETGRNVEVLNFGVSSYGLGHYPIVLSEKVLAFDPDLIVLGITYNDFGDILTYNLVDFNGDNLVFRDYPPESRNWLKNSLSKTQSAFFVKRKLEQSPVIGKTVDVILRIFGAGFLSDAEKTASRIGQDGGLPIDLQIFAPPGVYSSGERAYELSFYILEGMKKASAERNIGLFVFSIPADFQVKRERWDNLGKQYGAGVAALDPYLPGARLKEFSNNIGFEYLDLLPDFMRADGAGQEIYFRYDGHWNSDGHALAARSVAKEILPMITLK